MLCSWWCWNASVLVPSCHARLYGVITYLRDAHLEQLFWYCVLYFHKYFQISSFHFLIFLLIWRLSPPGMVIVTGFYFSFHPIFTDIFGLDVSSSIIQMLMLMMLKEWMNEWIAGKHWMENSSSRAAEAFAMQRWWSRRWWCMPEQKQNNGFNVFVRFSLIFFSYLCCLAPCISLTSQSSSFERLGLCVYVSGRLINENVKKKIEKSRRLRAGKEMKK